MLAPSSAKFSRQSCIVSRSSSVKMSMIRDTSRLCCKTIAQVSYKTRTGLHTMSQPKHKPSHSERPLGRDCRTSDSTWMAGLGPSGSGASSGFASVGSGLGMGTGEGSLSEPSSSSFSAKDSPGTSGAAVISDLALGAPGLLPARRFLTLDRDDGRFRAFRFSGKLVLFWRRNSFCHLLRVVPLGTWRTAVGRGRRILLRGVEEASSQTRLTLSASLRSGGPRLNLHFAVLGGRPCCHVLHVLVGILHQISLFSGALTKHKQRLQTYANKDRLCFVSPPRAQGS